MAVCEIAHRQKWNHSAENKNGTAHQTAQKVFITKVKPLREPAASFLGSVFFVK